MKIELEFIDCKDSMPVVGQRIWVLFARNDELEYAEQISQTFMYDDSFDCEYQFRNEFGRYCGIDDIIGWAPYVELPKPKPPSIQFIKHS